MAIKLLALISAANTDKVILREYPRYNTEHSYVPVDFFNDHYKARLLSGETIIFELREVTE